MKRKKTLILENEALRNEYEKISKQKVELETSITIFENVEKELNKKIEGLIKENEELKKAINILQTDKDNKVKEKNKNINKWLNGYYGEEGE